MSTSAINLPTTHNPHLERNSHSIQRSAFYLPGRGEPVFAWLHQSSQRRSLDHGVLICPPIGHEQLNSHRSLRHLADSLAQNQIPAVRFDWHGTGDSPGGDEDPRRIATWLDNIGDAVQWMRQHLGCEKISLVGLRLGATLAALATTNSPIENLILWSPIVKGRTYVRELKALSLTSEAPARASDGPSGEIEAGGLILNPETAAGLSGMDLMQVRPACSRVLIVSREEFHDDDKLGQRWATQGIPVRQISAPGFSEMMAEPHRNQVPHAAILQITDWITNSASAHARLIDPRTSVVRQHSVHLSARMAASAAPLFESTLWISKSPQLFGIVTEPDLPNLNARPTVVLLNAGSTHHVAPGRLNTLLARRLASEGFRCVRMDLNGLGDSVADSISNENDSYPATAFRDIDLTLKQIQSEFGAERIILMGLCSGAYAAFQSAAQIQNPTLVEAILINPLTFFWKDGMTLEASPTKHLMTFHYYQQNALDVRKWIRLLTGRSRLGIKGAIKILAKRFGWIKERQNATVSRRTSGGSTNQLSHPQKEDLRGDLKQIEGMNRSIGLFFSKSDPGFSILNYHAKKKARELCASGRMAITFIDDADHTFSRKAARSELIESILDHLHRGYSQ